jgi:hypothetical protein
MVRFVEAIVCCAEKGKEAEWVKWPGTIFGASALDE